MIAASPAADLTYAVAHVLIFVGYLIAVGIVGPAFNRIMRVRPLTIIGAGAFFLCCGITHLGLALNAESPGHLVFQINDAIQVWAIWTFLICLYLDLQDTIDRLAIAFIAIRAELGDQADWVLQTIDDALRGRTSGDAGAPPTA